jgi:hypothetical protein
VPIAGADGRISHDAAEGLLKVMGGVSRVELNVLVFGVAVPSWITENEMDEGEKESRFCAFTDTDEAVINATTNNEQCKLPGRKRFAMNAIRFTSRI